MRKLKTRFNAILFTRQMMNWWLGYVLSQPVDIDLSVFGYFVRNYVGYTFVSESTKKLRFLTTDRANGTDTREFEKVAA